MTSFQVSFPGLGIFDLTIDRIAFSVHLFGYDIAIYWYGILIALAFISGLVLALRQARQFNLTEDDVLDVFLLAVPLSLVGARLYFVLFSWSRYADDWRRILDVRDGGLGFYGGVLGGILALLLTAKRKHLHFSHFLDFFAPYLALGQAIGRWGNFFNQEAFGVATDLPWGMISEGTVHYLQAIGYPYAKSPVHPTFFYESLGNILIFLFLMKRRKHSTLRGETTAFYLFFYGLLRFFTEGLRTDSLYVGDSDIRISQLLSALMMLGSACFLLWHYLQRKKHPELVSASAFARPDQPSAATTGDPDSETAKETSQDTDHVDEDK